MQVAKSLTMLALLLAGVLCHLNLVNYSAAKNMRLRKAHLYFFQGCLGIFSISQNCFCCTEKNISQDIYVDLLQGLCQWCFNYLLFCSEFSLG